MTDNALELVSAGGGGEPVTVTRTFHLGTRAGRRGGCRRALHPDTEPPAPPAAPTVDRVHPLARRMAMAIQCQRLLESGAVADAATLADLAHVTRARMSQVLLLTLLAPDIQEAILDLPPTATISERVLRRVGLHAAWAAQRRIWATGCRGSAGVRPCPAAR